MMFYGVIGIIIMFSAKYLTTVIFSDIFLGGVGEAMTTTDWINKLYNNIVFPFIKVSITFKANPSYKEEETKKSKLLIHSTTSLR